MNKNRLVFLFGVTFSQREAEAGGRETKEEAERERETKKEDERERRKVEEERKEGSGVTSTLD